ncbi:DNA repair protein RadC [Saccharibacter sp. 17.LH.SD]|uniref:JAB domain-containing protein n=1 Tax=Saccharibacter sp. 17.LH.SD TaxID=2689393 RepID=UPI00136F4E13|nr:DNA repair protein RadC [Saccharibacter sp. 17.LH.SD]
MINLDNHPSQKRWTPWLDEKEALEREPLFSFLVSVSVRGEEDRQYVREYLIDHFGSLAELLSLSQSDRHSFPYKEPSFLVLIQILKELALRYNRECLPGIDLLENEQDLLDYLVVQMAREPVEQFRVLFLDQKNQLILDELQAKGTVNHTPVYPREIVKRCLELKAASIIMVHNHPSGHENPSEDDIVMTQHVQLALNLFRIRVADHYIITRSAQVSFRRLGLLS